jgi:hypothetical protein
MIKESSRWGMIKKKPHKLECLCGFYFVARTGLTPFVFPLTFLFLVEIKTIDKYEFIDNS